MRALSMIIFSRRPNQFEVKFPVVNRHMGLDGEQFIDDFFNTGTLRLGTFGGFRDLDTARQDQEEGHVVVDGARTDSMQITALTTLGNQAYVICGCTEETDEAKNNWGPSFRILDPLQF